MLSFGLLNSAMSDTVGGREGGAAENGDVHAISLKISPVNYSEPLQVSLFVSLDSISAWN